MAIVVLTTDLMLTSALAGAAERIGEAIRTAPPDGATTPADTAHADVRLVIVDLASVRGAVGDVLRTWNAASPRPRIVAFGPHVHEVRLAEARQAGCDEVLTRGQFHARMDDVLRRPE